MSDNSLKFLGQIIEAIFASEQLEGDSWDELAFVFMFDDDGDVSSTSGYTYNNDGKWCAESITPRLIEAKIQAFLNDLLKGKEGSPKAMLLQFNRATGRVNSELEYKDVSRWKVTPSNFRKIPEQIKPNLG